MTPRIEHQTEPLAALRRSDGSPPRVLVVDDEAALGQALARAFRFDGWEVQTVERGRDVLFMVRQFGPDVVILDIMLPDIDGFEVLRRLRNIRNETRVLVLTAKDAHTDRMKGLTAGGDDYVTKPFSIRELVARARRLAHSSPNVVMDGDSSKLTTGDLELDEMSGEVRRDGMLIELSDTEFELLHFLMRNPQRVLTKDQILGHVWGLDFGPSSNIVEMTISRLRGKIDRGRAAMIHTVRGVGYLIKPPE